MYIWIILSMFITALYAFNLHVRPDSNALYVEPQAQMFISKIALQHDIETKFFSYVHEQVADEMKLEEAIAVCDESGTNEDGSCKNVSEYISQRTKYAEEGIEDPFASNIAGQLGDYTRLSEIPLNFDVGSKDNREKDFIKSLSKIEGIVPAKMAKSMAFCVKAKDITSADPFESYYYGVCTSDKAANCCYGAGANDFNTSPDTDGNEAEKNSAALYVVTYAPIPVRWQQRDRDGAPTGMPNKDMIRAFRQFGGTDVELGYFVIKNKLYYIQGFKSEPVGIPTVIGDAIKDRCTKPTCVMAISQVK